MKISQAVIAAILAKGWNTLATFAYSCSYVPGQSSDDSFVKEVLEKVIVAHESSPDSPKLRRLFFESHTLAIQDLRRRSERTESDPVLKLPIEERNVRMTRLRAKYVGFEIEGIHEPSHALVDAIAAMLETGQIRYVAWSSCTTREQEVHGIKKLEDDLSAIVTDVSTGFLKRVGKPQEHVADVSTDLLLVQALQRRAFAFELACVCNFSVMASVSTKLMKEFTRTPLLGYSRVSLEQVANADRYLFTRIAALTTAGVSMRPDGSWPVADAVAAILLEPEFSFLLMQMPGKAGQGSSSSTIPVKRSERGDSRSRSRRRKVTEMHAKNRAAKEAARAAKGSGKGKGKAGRGAGGGPKGSGKGRGKFSRFDPAVETSKTADGKPICFGFQDGSCTAAVPGAACPRGMHVCWKISCGLAHAGQDHR